MPYKVDKSPDHVEHELSFDVAAEHVNEVIRILIPPQTALWFDEQNSARRDDVIIKRHLHLFLCETSGSSKRRVRIWRRGNRLEAYHEWKETRSGQKHESRLDIIKGSEDIAALIRARSPLVSAFMKERIVARYSIDGDKRRSFDVSFDRITPVLSTIQESFFHFEIEGDGSGVEVEFCNSSFFARSVAPFCRTLTMKDTKWIKAMPTTGGSIDTSEWTKKDLSGFLAAAEALHLARRRELNDPEGGS